MSILNRAGRALWRGVSKFLSSTSATTANQSVRQVSLNTSIQKSIKFLGTPIQAFGNNNFVAHARRKACKEFLQRNRRRLALASFVGLYLAETPDEGRKPDLTTLFKSYLQENFKRNLQENEEITNFPSKISEYEMVKRLGKPSSYGAVYHAKYQNKHVAIKMMFNPHTNSTSSEIGTILMNFKREYELLDSSDDEKSVIEKHPYIIPIKKKFIDKTAILYDSERSYPFYLPRNNDGFRQGCSKTLYLVMPKYTCTLSEFLQKNKQLPFRVSLHLLCQLLEGVAFLERNHIAHRDLKSDNILIKAANGNDSYPQLVIADFGSCFRGDGENGMLLPYQSEYVDKGGNPALMAPEIMNTKAGRNVCLDYSKADVWAIGAIAHQIFGKQNPLYEQRQNEKFPSLESNNWIVDAVVCCILQHDPNVRLSACEASTILCLLHFQIPRLCFSLTDEIELQRWILEMGFRVNRGESKQEQSTCREFQTLFKTFASRVTVQEVIETLQRFSTASQRYLVDCCF